MTYNEFFLPRKLTTQLLHLAQVSPDAEICGLVGRNKADFFSCYPITNTAATPATRFELEPQQQIAAMAQMRNQQEELFAIYHSHPSAPAEPSSTDIDMAAYPEVLYLIISLNTKGVLELRGFTIAEGTAEEVTLRMTP